jgi:hypothetical protein
MKKFLLSLLVLGLASSLSVRAGVLIGSLSTVTTAQTNSPTFQTNTALVTLPTVYVSNGNLTSTNSYTGYFRWSVDGSNFYTNGSPAFSPTATNAATYTIGAQTISVPVYVQLLAVTNVSQTGTIQIGAVVP